MDNLNRVIDEYCRQFQEGYKESLKSNGRYATGKLYNSVKVKPVDKGSTIDIVMTVEDYYKYIEDGGGVGGWAPDEKIDEWIKAKGIKPYPDKNGKLPTPEQLRFLIQRAIYENGITKRFDYGGSNDIKTIENSLDNKFYFDLESAAMQDAKEQIEEELKNILQ